LLNPFLLMAAFYLVVAIVAVLDATLTSLNLIPWFIGLPWLRVHFITLGVLTQAAFGVLPAFVAGRRGAAAPATRWDIWLVLNAGLVVLLAGMPSINATLIIAGGTLVFTAVTLLILQLRWIGGGQQTQGSGSLKFYLTGLVYLLVGIIIGTGLWVGWSEPLRIGVPKEAHIHANSWGFAALVFAGLLVDLLPALTGKPLAGRRAINAIFWAMSLGALGLVLGPWLGGNLVVTVPGLLLHIGATAALLILLAQALRTKGLYARAGAWHLSLSYMWILLPVMMAPLIILKVANVPGVDIEATAPQALIYGWMLQFLYAVTPYFAARWLLRDPAARLGGNWLSLVTVNLGSALIWASIFLADVRGPLHATAYALLGVSLIAAAWETGVITLAALRRAEQGAAQAA
jgi:cytochrome c oxidase cbb3-type subunit I